MKRFIYSGLILVMSGACVTTEAAEDTASWCEREWLTQSAMFADKDQPDYSGLLERWEGYGGKCQGTVTYEARLAFVYYLLDQPEKARVALQPVEHKKSQYDFLVEIAKVLIETTELTRSNSADTAHLERIEKNLQRLMKQHPDHVEVYGLLGGIETLLAHHEQAIEILESALKLGKSFNSKAGIYRNLTISYAEVDRYQDAYDAAENAMGLRRSVTDDQYFMYAVAKANAGLGNFADAQMDLKLVAAKKPELKSTTDFKSAVDFVSKKMEKSGQFKMSGRK